MRRSLAVLGFAGVLCATHTARAQPSSRVIVHVSGDVENVMVEQSNFEGRWTAVCAGTCDAPLETTGWYRVTAIGGLPSEPFDLEDNGTHHVELTVSHGHRSAVRIAGILLVPLGGGVIFTGLTLLASGALTQACSDCVSGYADTTELNIGWTMVGIGALMAVVGTVLIASGHRTAATIVTQTSFVRVTDPERRNVLTAGKTVGVPLLEVHF